ncbi:MAG: hypothetical protein RR838_09720, partial [Clostridium sp.]
IRDISSIKSFNKITNISIEFNDINNVEILNTLTKLRSIDVNKDMWKKIKTLNICNQVKYVNIVDKYK